MDQKNAPVHRLVHRFWNVAENFGFFVMVVAAFDGCDRAHRVVVDRCGRNMTRMLPQRHSCSAVMVQDRQSSRMHSAAQSEPSHDQTHALRRREVVPA
jgi:hypothetical protein